MRKPFICGNWKMNLNFYEALKLAEDTAHEAENYSDRDVLIAPPFIYLNEIKKKVSDKKLIISAQNLYFEEKGAFTGEISPLQLKSIGIDWTIIGHSERRNIFGETDEIINKKIKSAVKNAINVIFCVGEKLEERESGKTSEVLERQIREGLKGLSLDDILSVTIAYEPVWAIGTGRNATPSQASEAHRFIRNLLSQLYGENLSQKIRILYGGSVNELNIDDLMSAEDVDGVLVGGASIVFEKFKRIIGFIKK